MTKKSKSKARTKQAPKSHRVTLFRDTVLNFPELWLEVFINGPAWEERAFTEMFIRGHCTRASSPEEADLVVFVGGDDVDPLLYGELPHSSTSFDTALDKRDMEVYKTCYEQGIPMFGVCRGAQFLHVMNGGKLYQDVDGHNAEHNMYDVRENRMIQKVSSVHHQAVIPNEDGGMVILADTFKSTERWRNPTEVERGTGACRDIEAFFYRDSCCFGVQGHPEYKGYGQFMKWTLERLNEFVNENPDIVLNGRYRRIKDDILAMRPNPADLDKVLKELC